MGGIGIGISPAFGGFAQTYKDKVLGTVPDDLIAYWTLAETSGSTADNAEGTAARDGTYTGVTLNSSTGPDGQPVGLWDGANDYCDIFSLNFRAAFDGAEGTMLLWAKVSGAGVWTDGSTRNICTLRVNSNNKLGMGRPAGNNHFSYSYASGGTPFVILKEGISETGWMSMAITWSETADEMKAFYNGVQEGSTQTGLGTWAGDLADDRTILGATITTPTSVWSGYLAHAALWSSPLTPAQILELATV
jgi:hypothetical protein